MRQVAWSPLALFILAGALASIKTQTVASNSETISNSLLKAVPSSNVKSQQTLVHLSTNGWQQQLGGDAERPGGGRGGRQDGPPEVFRTEIPPSPLNVIESAPTDHSIRISICSSENTQFDLKCSSSSQATSQKGRLQAGEPQIVEIDGLKPGSTYTYQVSTHGKFEPLSGRFVTARSKGSTFVFDIQADSHLDSNSDLAVYENTLKNEIADKPDFLVDLGDTFMVDKYPHYQDSLKQYLAQRYWFSMPGSQMSIFLCLGNHDGETGWVQRGGPQMTEWSRAQRQRYFPSIRPDAFYSGAPENGLNYAWNWGDALFVVLDPFVATTQKPRNEGEGWNWTLGKTQFDWLESRLKSSTAKFKFVFIHHLVGGFGREARGGVEASKRFEWGDDDQFPSQRTGWAEPIHALMKRYKVSALFHGHDHLYVRQERDGIIYMEVPQPSAARENTRSAEEYGYTTGKLLPSSGHIRVTVAPTGVKCEYVKSRLEGVNREVVDRVEMGPSR